MQYLIIRYFILNDRTNESGYLLLYNKLNIFVKHHTIYEMKKYTLNRMQYGLRNCILVSKHFFCIINIKHYHFYLILHAFGISYVNNANKYVSRPKCSFSSQIEVPEADPDISRGVGF